ncbi:MAG: hypothetical protein L0Z71_14600 [Anaerolineae bacterium]|nr:hypothetical protein [Anaerolineae bacterium]
MRKSKGKSLDLWDADSEALIHDGWEGIVIPGEPVLAGELLVGQPHHLRITGAVAGFLYLPYEKNRRRAE